METEYKDIVEDFLKDTDYRVISADVRGEGGTRMLEIFVDSEAALSIEELTRINRELNKILDEKFPINHLSKLVVSSPGADKPFKFHWQLKKHIGRDMEIKMFNDEMIEGKLLNVTNEPLEIVTIEINHPRSKKDKSRKEPEQEVRDINFSDIKESKVKLKFK